MRGTRVAALAALSSKGAEITALTRHGEGTPRMHVPGARPCPPGAQGPQGVARVSPCHLGGHAPSCYQGPMGAHAPTPRDVGHMGCIGPCMASARGGLHSGGAARRGGLARRACTCGGPARGIIRPRPSDQTPPRPHPSGLSSEIFNTAIVRPICIYNPRICSCGVHFHGGLMAPRYFPRIPAKVAWTVAA